MLIKFIATQTAAVAQNASEHGQSASAIFTHLFAHLLPHEVGKVELFGKELPYYNLQIYQIAALLLMAVLFGVLAQKVKNGKPLTGLWRILNGWILWIRDEMVIPQLGKKKGQKLLPFFLCLFFFIMFCNLFGLLPYGVGGTATASFFVTGALAALTLLVGLGLGMAEQGVGHFWQSLLAPPGVPKFLLPLMAPIELIGHCTKHVALMIRLWANMTGGHLVLLSFIGFIFMAGLSLGIWAYGIGVLVVGFAAFITVIESFVALLQAYIFTLLSIVFIGAAMHPEH